MSGDERAMRRLVERLDPVIRATVRHVIRRHAGWRIGPNDVESLTQEIWLRLVVDDGKRLRAYDPNRARTLEGYVAMIARTEATHIVRREQTLSRGRGELQASIDDGCTVAAETDPEAEAIGSEVIERIRRRLGERLPEIGRVVFALLHEDGRSAAEAAAILDVKVQVIYNWQHKIRMIVCDAVREDG
ncbi:MAG: sigma-70 family RNA polymerase sigma factor [Myxococcales bacterium]|nr:sigma-70 family RNA polymerase sigma factor [Myxococcales bacterium]